MIELLAFGAICQSISVLVLIVWCVDLRRRMGVQEKVIAKLALLRKPRLVVE